jgi:dienelactone hydrolase
LVDDGRSRSVIIPNANIWGRAMRVVLKCRAVCSASLFSIGIAMGAISSIAAEPLRTLDSHFPFTVPVSREAAEQQSAALRQRLEVVLGLWPRPILDRLSPVIRGRLALDGYTVEKICFESLPGLWVTGSLYRPDPLPQAPMPGVLSPHGHWPNGRFYDAGDESARHDLSVGAERFEAAAHAPLQARCVQLARMGCTVLHWDMLGYADSRPISQDRAHGFAKFDGDQSPVTDEGWLLYSVPAESHGHSVMGLQTLNTLRALEVLQALPGVDPERIAITGASGGGTQAFIGAAISPQIGVVFPAVMVSTGMQGGCTCENACGLRVGHGNIDIAACIAPRPLGMTAADDWTKTMPEDGFPELQAVYRLFGAEDHVALFPFLHFPHNYNHPSRSAMYGWLNRHFHLGESEPVLERDFQRLSPQQMTVWDSQLPDPGVSDRQERAVLRQWHERTRSVLDEAVAAIPADRGERLKSILQPAYRVIVRRDPSTVGAIEWKVAEKRTIASGMVIHGNLIAPAWGQTRSAAFLYPDDWDGGVTLLASRDASAQQFARGEPAGDAWIGKLAQSYPKQAIGVIRLAAPDDLLSPAATESGVPDLQPLVQRDRLAAAYTYGYNDPLVVRQAQELLLLTAFCRGDSHEAKSVQLVADRSGTPAAALAGAVAGELIDRLELDVSGFRFDEVPRIDSAEFCPLVSRYFDIDGLLAVQAPRPLQVRGESPKRMPLTVRLYAAQESAPEWTN